MHLWISTIRKICELKGNWKGLSRRYFPLPLSHPTVPETSARNEKIKANGPFHNYQYEKHMHAHTHTHTILANPSFPPSPISLRKQFYHLNLLGVQNECQHLGFGIWTEMRAPRWGWLPPVSPLGNPHGLAQIILPYCAHLSPFCKKLEWKKLSHCLAIEQNHPTRQE